MRVTVSVQGKFHAYYLAQQLQRCGMLNRLITSYPNFHVSKYDIASRSIRGLVPFEVMNRASRRLIKDSRRRGQVQININRLFDYVVPYWVPLDTQIFIGWSSGCLHSLRWAQERGMKTMVVRGSTHIQNQLHVLKAENAKWGIQSELPAPQVVEREIEEYELADYIFNQTPHVKSTFLNNGISEDKIIQFPTGVDVSQFQPKDKRDDVFRIVYCGALSLRKGLIYLLKAFQMLRLPKAELVIVGGAFKEMEEFFKPFFGDNIIYKGVVPFSQVHDEMSQGSVFCFPSLEEGQAAVLAQAMACGLPIIATKESGAEVFVDDGQEGFFVPKCNVEAIAERLQWAYENQENLKVMGQMAIKRIHQGYTWDHYGDNMKEALMRIEALD
jgi:glycosyltransferase involved in cell wall biosynthesis